MREWLAIPPADYFRLNAYGSGAMRYFSIKGQYDFYHRYVLQQREEKQSDSQRMGRAFHAAMESETGWVDRHYRIPQVVEDDEFVRDTNSRVGGGKQLEVGHKLNLHLPSHRASMEAHQLRAEREGKDFLTDDEFNQVALQVAAIYDNPAVRELLAEKRQYNVESTCVLQHESGVALKALLDLTLYEMLVDFKTTRMRNKDDFIRDAYKNGYDWQAGHYCLVTGKTKFQFVSVTNEYPYESNVFEVPQRVISLRKREIEKQAFNLARLLNDKISDVDSQGVPLSFHSELWGTVIPMEFEMR